jgi:glucose-6-phosphate dehydrogenase assembly protein OpcA
MQLGASTNCSLTALEHGSHGIRGVYLGRATGTIELVRDLPGVATLRQPGQPVHDVALPRRSLRDCLADELRRLDPDELYGEVISRGLALLPERRTVDPEGATE